MTGFDDSSERPGQLPGLLSWLLPEGGDSTVPVILILDDAHELDELTVGFVGELLVSELPVLVIRDHVAGEDDGARRPFAFAVL